MIRAIAFASVLFLAPSAFCADDAAARAMKLYEKRHYAEAGAALQAELPSVEPGKLGAARLTLGMIYLKNAELHRALYQESVDVHLHYLQKLAAQGGKNRSRLAGLFLGETLLEAGKLDQAQTQLEKFISDEGNEPLSRNIAKADLGLCYSLKKNQEKAEELWTALDKSDPEIKAALAYAYAKAGLKDRNAALLADESIAARKKSGALSLRQVKNVLAAYAAAGLFDKGLEIARSADLKGSSYRESIGKTKIIQFYSVSLLDDLAQIYLQASIVQLEKAAEDAKLRETANYYLGVAYALAGRVDQSIRVTASFISGAGMPQQYRDRATILQAANQYRKGRQFEAIGTWDDLSRKQPEDPDLLAEILFSCGKLRIECPKIAQKAAASAEAGEGKRYANLNVAVGRYYLSRKNYSKALPYLEAGRDKGNKNKIEANEPVTLVSMADAYYNTKKFSEALEIYFEMSKQFPEVRQIQEALQGIYAMEHKSAGDVKIN